MAASDLVIQQGKTFDKALRWESAPIVYKSITGVAKQAPASITCVSHGVPDGWRVTVVSVKGMTQINSKNNPPKDKDYARATVVDSDTIELNTVNAADYKAYTSGGYVQYNTPTDMASYTARMSIKDKIGGTELLPLTTANSRILLDNVAKTITLTITAADTAAITWKKGVYDLEMVSPSDVVTKLLSGSVSVEQEVTTT
jgi:hypothetical protein